MGLRQKIRILYIEQIYKIILRVLGTGKMDQRKGSGTTKLEKKKIFKMDKRDIIKSTDVLFYKTKN
jgi:hypothetical protein